MEYQRLGTERGIKLTDVLNEVHRKYTGGDLDAAEVLADLACKLSPDNVGAQQTRASVYLAKQTRE